MSVTSVQDYLRLLSICFREIALCFRGFNFTADLLVVKVFRQEIFQSLYSFLYCFPQPTTCRFACDVSYFFVSFARLSGETAVFHAAKTNYTALQIYVKGIRKEILKLVFKPFSPLPPPPSRLNSGSSSLARPSIITPLMPLQINPLNPILFNRLFIALLFKFCAARIIVNLTEVSSTPIAALIRPAARLQQFLRRLSGGVCVCYLI